MGYTHYFYLPAEIDPKVFASIAIDTLKVAEASGVELAGEDWDEKLGGPVGDPIFGQHDLILFNGRGEGGHETFYFGRCWFPTSPGRKPQTDEQGRIFHFCKTARKFYDIVVTAALIVLKHHLGEAVHIASDGENPDWQPGRDLAQSTLGYGAEYAIQESEESGRELVHVGVPA